MSRHLVELAEEVTERLTTEIGGVELEPERVWFVTEELEHKPIDKLQLWVVPIVSQPTGYLDRIATNYQPLVSIVMQAKLSELDNEHIDPLMLLAGEIMEFWRARENRSIQTIGSGAWTVEGPEFRDGVGLVPDHIYNLRQFTSVLDLSFRLVA